MELLWRCSEEWDVEKGLGQPCWLGLDDGESLSECVLSVPIIGAGRQRPLLCETLQSRVEYRCLIRFTPINLWLISRHVVGFILDPAYSWTWEIMQRSCALCELYQSVSL